MAVRHLLTPLFMGLISACAGSGYVSTEPPVEYLSLLQDERLAASGAVVLDEEARKLDDFLELPEDIRDYLDREILPMEEVERYQALREWAFSEFTEHYKYDPTYTSSLADLPDSRRVNCFSFSNMFVAAARYSGIDAKFQLVDSPPEWDAEEGTLITTQHINVTGRLDPGAVARQRAFITVQPEETGTRIRDPAARKPRNAYIVDLNPEIASDVFDTREISDQQALALFYSNKTVETMLDGDVDSAFQYARLAIDADEQSAVAWHNLGVLFGRGDRLADAEQAYLTALAFDPRSDSTLSNLEKVYRQQGKDDAADALAERLLRNRQKNPYFFYAIGKLWMSEGDPQNASIFFEEAIDRKGDEELFYYALAESQIELGHFNRAQRSLRYAKKHARDEDMTRFEALTARIEPHIQP